MVRFQTLGYFNMRPASNIWRRCRRTTTFWNLHSVTYHELLFFNAWFTTTVQCPEHWTNHCWSPKKNPGSSSMELWSSSKLDWNKLVFSIFVFFQYGNVSKKGFTKHIIDSTTGSLPFPQFNFSNWILGTDVSFITCFVVGMFDVLISFGACLKQDNSHPHQCAIL